MLILGSRRLARLGMRGRIGTLAVFCVVAFAGYAHAVLNTNARAASLLGSVGTTTVAGTDAYTTSMSFPVDTAIGESIQYVHLLHVS